MDNHTATEIAYKNGYEQGKKDAVKHGWWIDIDGDPVPFSKEKGFEGCPRFSCYCSVCNEWLTASDEYACFGNYCPNCGAKMDGKSCVPREEF